MKTSVLKQIEDDSKAVEYKWIFNQGDKTKKSTFECAINAIDSVEIESEKHGKKIPLTVKDYKQKLLDALNEIKQENERILL